MRPNQEQFHHRLCWNECTCSRNLQNRVVDTLSCVFDGVGMGFHMRFVPFERCWIPPRLAVNRCRKVRNESANNRYNGHKDCTTLFLFGYVVTLCHERRLLLFVECVFRCGQEALKAGRRRRIGFACGRCRFCFRCGRSGDIGVGVGVGG